METLPRHEQEPNPDAHFSVPLCDILKNPAQAAELWPDDATELIPQIEQRQHLASQINQYLDNFYQSPSPEEHQQYLAATSELLQNPDYERLALFLPFESFPTPEDHSKIAENFRQSYLSAWQELLFVSDVRASFNDGDILEVDARQSEPEKIVKAAHLAPFLIQAGMLDASDILDIMEFEENPLLSWSFLDTVPMMKDLGQLNSNDLSRFAEIQQNLPERPAALPPKYISERRQEWLDEQAAATRPSDFTPANHELANPASTRLEQLQPEIELAEQLASKLNPEQTTGVIFLNGSRLKGYGQPQSDLDLYTIAKTDQAQTPNQVEAISMNDLIARPMTYAHEVFNAVWAGAPEQIKALQQELAPIYFHEKRQQYRQWNAERLEQDLLEYRLMHKGYARLCPDTNPEYKKYTSMDGQSAFYETGYRVIATKIFANSIFIPKITNN